MNYIGGYFIKDLVYVKSDGAEISHIQASNIHSFRPSVEMNEY
jgi:hypothetical protein